MFDFYFEFWKNIFNIRGTISRKDYWLTVLINAVGFFVVMFIAGLLTSVLVHISEEVAGVVFGIIYIGLLVALIIGALTMTIRRLHDANFSGKFALMGFVPILYLALLVMVCLPSVYENNVHRIK